MNDAPIAAYLAELDHELRVKRAPRRRLLAETSDHLRSSADDLAAAGLDRERAERHAVARFGAAAVVARRFAHAAASTAARTAFVWAMAAFAGYALLAIAFVVAAPAWLRDFPQAAPSAIGLQVAFVALAVSTLRVARSRKLPTIDEPQLRFVANAVIISTVALVGAAALEVLVAWTRPAAAPWHEATTLFALFAGAASAAVAAAFVAAAAGARASAVQALPRESGAVAAPETAALIDDVAAVAPPLASAAAFVASRPARTCVLLAGCAFAGAAVASLWGTDFTRHASIVLGAAATGLFEAAAAVAGYLVLGRALGFRPRPHAADAKP